MQWSQVRKTYPEQWLVIEAIEAHSEKNRRLLDQIAVVEVCPNGTVAMQRYRHLHQQYPQREFYFAHTGREQLDIRERHWLGVRRGHALNAEG